MKKKILAALTAGILTTGLMTGTVFAADTEVKGDENLKGEVYAFIAAASAIPWRRSRRISMSFIRM